MIEDPEGLEESIEWFNELSEMNKAQIIDDFDESELLSDNDNAANFFKLLTETQNILSYAEEDQMAVRKLEEHGMSSGYATAFVENVLKEEPPISLRVESLDSLSDEGFSLVVDRTIEGAISEVSPNTILDEADIESEATLSNIQEYLVTILKMELRGEFSIEQLREQFTEEGLSEDRVDYIIDKYESHQDDIRKATLFRTIERIYNEDIKDLKDNQREIILLLREVLEELRSVSGNDEGF